MAQTGSLNVITLNALFVALTCLQIFAGVIYTVVLINAIISGELLLVFRALWVLLAAFVIQAVGTLACREEPRIFDLWSSGCGTARGSETM